MVPSASLGATRSSGRWAEMPGNWDRLNTRALFPSGNEFGIPDLPAAMHEPGRFVPYSDRHPERSKPGDCIHFFLDDRRFETVWNKPERPLSRLQSVGMSLTPDFSLWLEMPPVMQQWQVYRSRWCGAWMLAHGINVIPTVSWAGPESHAFAFAGIAEGSVVALSAVGCRRDWTARKQFALGYGAMLERIRPSLILAYGSLPDGLGGTAVRTYPTRWERWADGAAPERKATPNPGHSPGSGASSRATNPA